MALHRILLVLVACTGLLAGCGSDDTARVTKDVRQRAERVRDDARALRTRAERLSKRVSKRVQAVLDDLEKAVPEAAPNTRAPSARGQANANEIDRLLTSTITSVDAYWTKTLTAAGRPEPRVSYKWVAPGERLRTGCGAVADDRAAFYCPADDTIYVAQVMAAELYQGLNDQLPGQRAGYGRAVGDFGVAYIVAHEYAHNLQNEFGTFRQAARGSSKPFELQADCMAGLWGNSVYRAGKLKPGDIEEAMNTALAVGDFDYSNRNHHGTPNERRDAWVTGFERGDPADCQPFVAG
ncbi:MAG: neutral zinc metallopeptidase [Solirubrobacterales bacterium]|jgi:predicted metalloprotease|nr:neutral zinc metallopeptidase [Solirubrobacterales bacterium]